VTYCALIVHALDDAEVIINISNPMHYGEPTVGSCAVSNLYHCFWRLIKVERKEACNITLTNKLDINYYTRNFTVTCNNKTKSLVI